MGFILPKISRKFAICELESYKKITMPSSHSSASSSSYFTSRKRASSTHWIGYGMDPRAGIDMMEKRKISSSTRNPTLTVQSRVSQFSDSTTVIKRMYDV
jgi:hypothetical protein